MKAITTILMMAILWAGNATAIEQGATSVTIVGGPLVEPGEGAACELQGCWWFAEVILNHRVSVDESTGTVSWCSVVPDPDAALPANGYGTMVIVAVVRGERPIAGAGQAASGCATIDPMGGEGSASVEHGTFGAADPVFIEQDTTVAIALDAGAATGQACAATGPKGQEHTEVCIPEGEP